ncbi:hypothetical protein VNO77_02391 [Canavalia gladiata]|uniref:Uncharacterized protein n=1 Tax=Canavalia gladiata TaxID=3824 RepID=A0AAN9MY60_CANGL
MISVNGSATCELLRTLNTIYFKQRSMHQDVRQHWKIRKLCQGSSLNMLGRLLVQGTKHWPGDSAVVDGLARDNLLGTASGTTMFPLECQIRGCVDTETGLHTFNILSYPSSRENFNPCMEKFSHVGSREMN